MTEYMIVGDTLDIACLIGLLMVAAVVALMVKASRQPHVTQARNSQAAPNIRISNNESR